MYVFPSFCNHIGTYTKLLKTQLETENALFEAHINGINRLDAHLKKTPAEVRGDPILGPSSAAVTGQLPRVTQGKRS